MSFADRLRAWFKGESKRAAPSPSTEKASRSSTRELSAFVDTRRGVEAYLEPKTALYSTTVLLIAADGEYLRRPVGDPGQAASFCDRHDIPLYDARKVGYPRRMRDYERGAPQRGIGLDELPPWPGDATGAPPKEADSTSAAGEGHAASRPDESGPPPPPVEHADENTSEEDTPDVARPDEDAADDARPDDGPPTGPPGR